MSETRFLDDVKDLDTVHADPYAVRGSRYMVQLSWTLGARILLDGVERETETSLMRREFGHEAYTEESARRVCDWVRKLGEGGNDRVKPNTLIVRPMDEAMARAILEDHNAK